MLTLYVICILCSIMSPWVVGVRTNCNPIIEKNVLSIRYKQRHVKNPFGCLWGPRGKIDVCNSVSDWQVAEIDLEAEALLFSNSKRKTNEDWGVHDWKRHCHCRTTKQYWNSFIYLCSPLFFCVLSLVSAFVSQFVDVFSLHLRHKMSATKHMCMLLKPQYFVRTYVYESDCSIFSANVALLYYWYLWNCYASA